MKKSKRIKLKDNKGFTMADITISVTIILIFVSIIVTAYYNYYLSITSKNRNTIATNCIIDVIENIEMMQYEDINEENVNKKVQELYKKKIIPNQYEISVVVEQYNTTEGNESKKDLIKTIKVTVQYEIGKKIQKLEISTLITKK